MNSDNYQANILARKHDYETRRKSNILEEWCCRVMLGCAVGVLFAVVMILIDMVAK